VPAVNSGDSLPLEINEIASSVFVVNTAEKDYWQLKRAVPTFCYIRFSSSLELKSMEKDVKPMMMITFFSGLESL
jgi:hypothetical protein